MTESVFAKYEKKSWPYRFEGTMLAKTIAGGTPSDPKVAEGFLRTKLIESDDLIRQAVAQTMAERGVTMDEAVDIVNTLKHLIGFRRDEHGLYVPGNNLKAALKEFANIAATNRKISLRGWGTSNKGAYGWTTEHVFVEEDRLYLGVNEPTGIAQSFPKGRNGTSIQYAEYVENAKIDFTVVTDYDFTEEHWAHLWLTGGKNGFGACRSQGFGQFTIVRWDPVTS